MIYNGKKLAILGLLSGLAIIIGFVENMMPPIFAMIPYARLGLANVVILLVLVLYDMWEGAVVLAIKVIMIGIFSGNPSMILYSLCGSILSVLMMWALLKFKKNSLMAISSLGGVMHNFGQVAVAAFVTKNNAVFSFLPHLMLFGAMAGVVTGILCHLVVKRAIPPSFLK